MSENAEIYIFAVKCRQLALQVLDFPAFSSIIARARGRALSTVSRLHCKRSANVEAGNASNTAILSEYSFTISSTTRGVTTGGRPRGRLVGSGGGAGGSIGSPCISNGSDRPAARARRRIPGFW